ncbi:hypothetical protein CUJ83_08645 [Methanocella sp. CWC-04]|uniref:histidine kinase n=2 Tax=Methanooceanicella nereidis TaxID=2052831 RepID=A0AAP2W7C7_9EURY|nr:hypothetical protein [Methanocella sp. CWC-04]
MRSYLTDNDYENKTKEQLLIEIYGLLDTLEELKRIVDELTSEFHKGNYSLNDLLVDHEGTVESLRQANRALEALSKCDAALVHATEERALLDEICRIIVEVGGYRLAWIGLIEDGGNVRPAARAGYDDGYLDNVRVTINDTDRGRGPFGTSIRTKEPCISRNILTDPKFLPWRAEAIKRGYASAISLPMIENGEPLGALAIYSERPDAFDTKELELLKELADNLTYGIISLRARILHKQAKEKLRKAYDELENKVRERTAELLDTNEKLKTEIASKIMAEETLGFERAQLLSIFDSIDEVIYVSDPETYEILYSNKAMKEQFGKELTGGICYREIQGRDSPCEFCSNEIILQNKGEPYQWEFHNSIVNKDYLIVDRMIKWPDGRSVRFEMAKDITDRKRTEEELLKAKFDAELYVDLMGHDINNMNQISMGYLELAQDILDLEGKLETDNSLLIDKPLEMLRNSSELIDNIRKVQNERAGVYKPEVIDLDRILKGVQAQYSGMSDRNIYVSYRPCDRCYVKANELLRDVFSNIAGNAIKHSKGDLEIHIVQKIVNEDGKDYCMVTIEDNGPGINDELKKKLFERLSQSRRSVSGKGFGLYLINMLVDDFGGRFWVEDRVHGDHSKGCKFVVMLPALGE